MAWTVPCWLWEIGRLDHLVDFEREGGSANIRRKMRSEQEVPEKADREWDNPERVAEYLSREIPHRDTAERMLLQALPEGVGRVLDLGTGDGRLLAVVRSGHPAAECVGLDASPVMLTRCRERFSGDPLVEAHAHDLNDPLTLPGRFDAVVSGLAIHHLEAERKRELFCEIHALLAPGGVFANLDLVSSPTEAQHERFRREIGRVRDDPTDRLSDLCEQLVWLGESGFREVDCHFKWLELSLMVGKAVG